MECTHDDDNADVIVPVLLHNLRDRQGWNTIYPENRFSQNKFTASSVVVMGAMSGLTAVTRALNGGFSEKVILCKPSLRLSNTREC